jgi:S-adenosylmethionine decarboxylase
LYDCPLAGPLPRQGFRARIRTAMMGTEWIVDAYGCSPDLLQDLATLQNLFARMVADLYLHPCETAQWHRFDAGGGITGISMLSESHLACHTFPEHGTLCLNLFCCRPRPEWPFAQHLHEMFGAQTVNVRRLERPYIAAGATAAHCSL